GRVRVGNRDVRLPERRQRRVGHLHQAADVRLAVLEDLVAAVLLAHVGRRPAEDGVVEPLGAFDVLRTELVPDEHALPGRAVPAALERDEDGALGIREDRERTDPARSLRAHSCLLCSVDASDSSHGLSGWAGLTRRGNAALTPGDQDSETEARTLLDTRLEITAMRADGSEFPVELTITLIDV